MFLAGLLTGVFITLVIHNLVDVYFDAD